MAERSFNMKRSKCWACAHSYMEPASPYLVCGHPDSGIMGLFIKSNKSVNHCSNFSKFEQHPLRNSDGSLKTT